MAVCRTEVPQPHSGLPHKRPAAAALEDLPAPSRPIRILRLTEVIGATGLGKTKIYELQAAGHFPMRVQITAHSVGWVEEEVQAWLAQRVAVRSGLPLRSACASLRPLR